MSYVNVGALDVRGARIQTKGALKKLMADDPAQVVFDPTSPFNAPDYIHGDQLPLGTKLSVCGPDPQTSRKWFATVEKTGRGVKVS